jgi:hypothetical protein
MAFLKPWCSSLIAVQCLEETARFKKFNQVCMTRNDGFYGGVDERITSAVLMQAATIAADAPTGSIRQDQGVVPHFKFYRDYSLRAPLSADHEAAVAHAYALLGLGLASVFEFDVQRIFQESSARVVTVAPKQFQRMQNKLLNPADHGDPKAVRPRCAKNVDVLRGCIVVRTVQDLEAVYDKLQKAFKVVRVKNTHDPSTDGWRGGYRSLLVNFIYEPGVKWAELFGDKLTFDLSDIMKLSQKQPTRLEGQETSLGDLWLNYVESNSSIVQLLGLQGLQIISSEHPNEPVRMIAELQLVLEPYFEGRAVSHMLFKIARCDTGAMEMVRDFFQEYYQKTTKGSKHMQAVREIATAVNKGRRPSKRVPLCERDQQ